jgi:hypothetical protein
MHTDKLSWMPRFVTGLVSVVGVAAIVVACGNGDDDDTTPPPGTDAGTGTETSTGGGGQGAACGTTNPGQLPAATCDISGTTCSDNGAVACSQTSSASCNTSSSCLALASNTGTTDNFRVRALYLAAPKALTFPNVQGGIVTAETELDNAACGQNGSSLFNWLMTIDTSAMTLKTGGAPTPSDTSGAAGFCYENDMQDGLPVQPATAPLTKNSDGSYSTSTPIADLNIPFGVPDSSAIIVLPLHNVSVNNITVSESGNCIGSYKSSPTTSAGCVDIDGCQRWNTSAALGGYITLAEADQVDVVQIGESLCALLSYDQTNSKDSTTNGCAKSSSGAYIAQGDWCSTSNSAATATCADAFWLSSTFAASAVTIDSSCN